MGLWFQVDFLLVEWDSSMWNLRRPLREWGFSLGISLRGMNCAYVVYHDDPLI